MRIESGTSRIAPEDLAQWGELRQRVAWSILGFCNTDCSSREARLELLQAFTDEIVGLVLSHCDYYAKYR